MSKPAQENEQRDYGVLYVFDMTEKLNELIMKYASYSFFMWKILV